MNPGPTRTGARLVREALECLPVGRTFGIPGVHNTEIYDELGQSSKITPILVTHEMSAAFMADAVSRTAAGEIGVMVTVPAAGITHALSGIGEAWLGGIPLLIITGGIRTDLRYRYQIHEIDQHVLLASLTKQTWKVSRHEEIVPAIFAAYRLAVSGRPGPVMVEIPVNVQLVKGEAGAVPACEPPVLPALTPEQEAQLDAAVELLVAARRPGLFVGWGAVDVVAETIAIADCLGAPVSTTLQGLSAFPAAHPLHAGMGFSRAAVPAAERAFAEIDALLAIGTRFAEIPTGSFGCRVPENLVHLDIDGEVLGRNFPAKVAIEGDARVLIPALRRRLEAAGIDAAARREAVAAEIARDKRSYRDEWLAIGSDRVNPLRFFDALRRALGDEAIVTIDDGNHTYLTAELFQVAGPRTVICPTDFNAMGYCVPAAIGAKLARPERRVVGIAGDGAFLMTGMELTTAASYGAGVVIFVFNDGELSQIAQGQEIPYNRKTCTVLGEVRLAGIAEATGAAYLVIENDAAIGAALDEAFKVADTGRPVVVDVRIDYRKRTRFTQGVVKTVLGRFPLRDRLRIVARAVGRRIVKPR